ncbi:MAG: sodium-independent anion transporter, partial [Myroides sp.]|nr:sodium-independent anion transporter [Myroides sp.]
MLQNIFGIKDKSILIQNEILAGLTVAMTMIPESLSFAILAGLHPLTGLYAAFLMGIITAIFGGRPGMVSGGAGATIIVMISLISMYGVEYLFAAVVLAGIIQILVGVLKLGRFVRFIPQPVMYGFLNGLAVVIFFAQIAQFKIDIDGVSTWLSGIPLYMMIGLTLLTIFVVTLFPKITKKVPATLIAIIVTTAVVFLFQLDTRKVVDIA